MTISPPMGTTGQQVYPPAPVDPAFHGQVMPPVGPPPAPGFPPAPQPPRRRGMWPVFAAFVAVTLGAVGATAAITYNIAHNDAAAAPAKATPIEKTAPEYTPAEVDAAKAHLCQVFDASTKGQTGQGGMIKDGQLNVPLAVRSINSVMAVQNALTPATPPDVAAAAKKYIDASVALTTAATGTASIDEGNRLNDLSNTATYAFADVCGLPH